MLLTCGSCHRHVRADETCCPFCGTTLRTARAPALLGAVLAGALTLVGCGGDKDVGQDEAGTTTGVDGTTTDESSDESNSSTTTGETTTTDDSTDPSGSFYAGPEPDLNIAELCDTFAQDCPEGEKCVPFDSGGGSFDDNKCVQVQGNGAPGDACMYDGPLAGTDDCGVDSWCWNVDARGQGECAAFCTGTADNPVCPPDNICHVHGDAIIALCTPLCDPLLQDCGDGQGCYWDTQGFICVPHPPGGPALGDPCGFVNDCEPGLTCIDGAELPSCDGSACCATICLVGGDPCPTPGTECVPVYDMGTAPAGYEDVGFCTLPN